jgi:small subunit ribosomal protein S10
LQKFVAGTLLSVGRSLRLFFPGRVTPVLEKVGMQSERIRIRMEGYDHEALDRTALEIISTAKNTGAEVHGPIPLPTRIERYTVLRSPHIDRKSREQFEIRTHKRLIDILQPTVKTIEALNKGLSLPPGVDIKIRVMGQGG